MEPIRKTAQQVIPMTGSSTETRRDECPSCGGEVEAFYVALPPALAKREGIEGLWDVPFCSQSCAEKEDRAEWEEQQKVKRLEELRRRSGMPPRLEHMTFKTFDALTPEAATAAGKAIGYVAAWDEMRRMGEGLFLVGAVGAGKTHLAAAIGRKLMRTRGVPVLFVTVPEMLDSFRPSKVEQIGVSAEAAEREGWWKAAKGAELLILDDLGAEKASEWVEERIFVLLNHRYRMNLPVIITSNARPSDLKDRLGTRTSSRLLEMCEGVNLGNVDQREAIARRRREARKRAEAEEAGAADG